MSQPNFQLSARMKRKNLSLDEKIKVIDYANKNPKMDAEFLIAWYKKCAGAMCFRRSNVNRRKIKQV